MDVLHVKKVRKKSTCSGFKLICMYCKSQGALSVKEREREERINLFFFVSKAWVFWKEGKKERDKSNGTAFSTLLA